MSRKKANSENRAPFTRDDIARDVRLAALGLASHIAAFGPRLNALKISAEYLGVELESYDHDRDGHPELDKIPIEEHTLYRVVMDAYEYAYQLGDAFETNYHLDDRYYEVAALLDGFPRSDFNGEPTPLDRLNPQKLRQVLETFNARYKLDKGDNLTVTQLALLANMGEAAVRTSLSAEGIKTVASHEKSEKNQVPHSDAMSWLSGRRGFVPTRDRLGNGIHQAELMQSLFSADSLTFEVALQKAMSATGVDAQTLGEQAGQSAEWMHGLLATDAVLDVDLTALERLSNVVGAPAPIFVGKAVTALLKRRDSAPQRG